MGSGVLEWLVLLEDHWLCSYALNKIKAAPIPYSMFWSKMSSIFHSSHGKLGSSPTVAHRLSNDCIEQLKGTPIPGCCSITYLNGFHPHF